MSEPTEAQRQALTAICDAILETVSESEPLGAPAGPLYAGLMAYGCSLSQFEEIMGALVRFGKLRQGGHVYHLGTGSLSAAPTLNGGSA